jgi:molecular chaperone GrpE
MNDEKNAATPSDQSKSADGSTEDLQKRIQELEAQSKEKEAKYLYLYADFENYKKRAIKERSDLIKYGWEPTARELLQVVDNLERALAHVPPQTDKNLLEGLNMVLNQFKSTLQKQGVTVIESLEKVFDPNLHEAVGQEPSTLPSGTITQEHMRGYTLHGRLLRPARVIISNGQEAEKVS